MTRTHEYIASAPMQLFTGAALSALWILFAIAHIVTFRATGKVSLLVFGVAETLVAIFFLLRTQPKSFTTRPHEWLIAVTGTFLPLLVRPTTDTPLPAVEWGLVLGAAMQTAGMLSLNRSFALVPALRELKTEGMYRLVRHPIYLSYLITHACYLAANFSIHNLLIISGSISLMLTRIHFEERHLSLASDYRAYQNRVPWRLIPFVF